ncbi:hypothetical protein [Vibrio mediterranei]|uniref:hypothetical protein n=1 Tax=Vibrio mediterranei TaxID=689 RepID=UPI002283E1D7|nr:hypothetical protein [Vibrio mediterranei]MCY9855662.1 hypothetical protein [Vibrio mediterranei]
MGGLIQVDGAPHDWLEGRADECTLLVFIDDATSAIMHMYFYESGLLQKTEQRMTLPLPAVMIGKINDDACNPNNCMVQPL